MGILLKVAEAAGSADGVINTVIPKITTHIVLPLIKLIFALATFYFVWGIYKFFTSGEDTTKREEGQNHILWGVIGLAIMISVYGIIRLVASTVGQNSVLGF